MSWLDEALAQQSARNARSAGADADHATDSGSHAQQQAQAFDALIQQLLSDYGERAMGKRFWGRRYGTLLESPGQRQLANGSIQRWDWHWHLHSYVSGIAGLEIHPQFDEHGAIVSFLLKSGNWQEVSAPDEDALREALVHAFVALHSMGK